MNPLLQTGFPRNRMCLEPRHDSSAWAWSNLKTWAGTTLFLAKSGIQFISTKLLCEKNETLTWSSFSSFSILAINFRCFSHSSKTSWCRNCEKQSALQPHFPRIRLDSFFIILSLGPQPPPAALIMRPRPGRLRLVLPPRNLGLGPGAATQFCDSSSLNALMDGNAAILWCVQKMICSEKVHCEAAWRYIHHPLIDIKMEILYLTGGNMEQSMVKDSLIIFVWISLLIIFECHEHKDIKEFRLIRMSNYASAIHSPGTGFSREVGLLRVRASVRARLGLPFTIKIFEAMAQWQWLMLSAGTVPKTVSKFSHWLNKHFKMNSELWQLNSVLECAHCVSDKKQPLRIPTPIVDN